MKAVTRSLWFLAPLGVLVCIVAFAHAAEMRLWASADGKHTVFAELVKVDGDVVVLRRDDGKTIRVPLAKLSAEDRKFAISGEGDDPGPVLVRMPLRRPGLRC